jgi:hypothetical protein
MSAEVPTFDEWLADHPDASPATRAFARDLLENQWLAAARVLSRRESGVAPTADDEAKNE